MSQDTFFTIASSRSVVGRATKVALIVGWILALINHGDSVLNGSADYTTALKIVLTFIVPYCVSTFSSVRAIQLETRKARD